jgi:hypothetical protein
LGDDDDAAICAVPQALDEPALLHPVDDPGCVRIGHAEQIRQAGHRQRSVLLQDPERLQVRHADALPVQPPGDCAALMAGDDGGPDEDLVDQGPAPGSVGRVGMAGRVGGLGWVSCYDHQNNLSCQEQFVNGNHFDHGKHQRPLAHGDAPCGMR